jgi:hypothetical protein
MTSNSRNHWYDWTTASWEQNRDIRVAKAEWRVSVKQLRFDLTVDVWQTSPLALLVPQWISLFESSIAIGRIPNLPSEGVLMSRDMTIFSRITLNKFQKAIWNRCGIVGSDYWLAQVMNKHQMSTWLH